MKKFHLLFFFVCLLLVACSPKEILEGDYMFNDIQSEKDKIVITIDGATLTGNVLHAQDKIDFYFSIQNNSEESINIVKKDIRLIDDEGEKYKYSDWHGTKSSNFGKNVIDPGGVFEETITYDFNINHFNFNELTIEFPVKRGEWELIIPVKIKREDFIEKETS